MEVSFYRPSTDPSAWIKITEDPTPTNDPTDVIGPLVLLSGDEKTQVYPNSAPAEVPVAYVSGSTPVVSAVITSDCLGSSNIWLKGKSIIGETDWVQTTYDPVTQTYRSGQVEFLSALPPDLVQIYEEVSIDWYINLGNVGEGEYFASNAIDFYVTHNEPNLNHVLRSFLHISCAAAVDQSSENSVFESIWSDFTDRNVTKYGSTEPMFYWGGNYPPQNGSQTDSACFTGEALIAYNDATCGAWADLLVKLLNCQGLEDSGSIIEIRPSNVIPGSSRLKPDSESLFSDKVLSTFGPTPGVNMTSYVLDTAGYLFVKNYKGDLQNIDFAINEDQGSMPTSLIVDNGSGPTDTLTNGRVEGLPAQGYQNDNPRSDFTNHAIVTRGGLFYDPSYGTGPFMTINEYYASAIEGAGSKVTYHYVDANNRMRTSNIIWIELIY